MKKLIAALLLLPSLCLAAAGDYGIDRRNATNNNWEKVLLLSPATSGVLGYDPVTKLSTWLTLGSNVQVLGGVLSSSVPAQTWVSITGKPEFFSGAYADLTGKPVLFDGAYSSLSGLPTLFSGAYADLSGKPSLFSGAYADLTGKPAIPAAQVNADWNAVSGVSQVLNKPSLFSGAYSDLTGKPALFDGAYISLTGVPSTFTPAAHTHASADIVSGTLAVARIPALPVSQTTGLQAALDSKFAVPTGNTSQYLRGDGTVAAFPNIPATQVNSDWNSVSGVSQILNKPTLFSGAYADLTGKPTLFSGAYADLTGKPTLFSGAYADLTGKPTIPAAQINSDWNSVSGLSQILNRPTLATVATSGSYNDLTGKPTIPAAQVNADWNAVSGVAQILNKPTLNSGTVTSVTAGTGLSGGVITTTGTISLPNTGTAGTYANVTTDAQGRVTGGTSVSINDNPGRTLVTSATATGFQISATRIASVCYEGSFSTTSTIGGPSSASVFLETADTNSTTASDWTIRATQVYSNNITLAIVLNQVQGNNWSMCRYIPAGKFVRIRSGSITGTASASLNTTQQEVLQ